jgi:hypothetical protein
LALPGALFGRTECVLKPDRAYARADEVSYYEEETYREEESQYEDETCLDDDEDEDDYWDDYTIQTVADAFVALPRSIQLEFLLSTQTSTKESWQTNADDQSLPFDEPYAQTDWKDEENNGQSEKKSTINGDTYCSHPEKNDNNKSSINTASTVSESGTFEDATEHSDEDGQMTETQLSQLRPLKGLLRQDLISPDSSFVEAALRDLAIKVKDDHEYRAAVVKAGGILAIVRSMKRNVANPDIQVYACQVLENLSIDSKTHWSAIDEIGGVEAVVGALANHMELPRVAEVTCGCIFMVVTKQVKVEVYVVDMIVSCMQCHPTNVTVQEKAFQALASICLDDKDKLIALSQIGGFAVISESLTMHWDHAGVKKQAISTLARLFGRLAEYQQQEEE